MNSSGRLPSADWRTPVAPGPSRCPSWSVAVPDDRGERRRAPPRDTTKTESHAGARRRSAGRNGQRSGRADRRDEQDASRPAEERAAIGARAGGTGAVARCADDYDAATIRPVTDTQPPRRRDEPVPAPARPQPGRLVSVGPGGAGPARSRATGRSSSRSATRPATGATSWSASRSRTRRRPRT